MVIFWQGQEYFQLHCWGTKGVEQLCLLLQLYITKGTMFLCLWNIFDMVGMLEPVDSRQFEVVQCYLIELVCVLGAQSWVWVNRTELAILKK